MTVKLVPLIICKRLPEFLKSRACFSSIPCANVHENFAENSHNLCCASESEQSIQLLRNKLVPENLVGVLNNISDLKTSMEVFNWVFHQKSFFHTVDTYYHMILKLGLAGSIAEMDEFCLDLVKNRIPGFEEALTMLVNTFVSHGRLSEATRVLLNMNLGGFKPSIVTYNVVLCALVEEKRVFQDVLFVYKEMVKAGVLPNVDTLNYLLDALFETHHVVAAMDQFWRMNRKGCNPNSKTFELLIKGLISKNLVDEAVVVLGLMFKLGTQPELSFYTCTVPLFCLENKPEEGIRLFKMMKACNYVPDSLIYGALIQCLCKNLLLDDVISLLDEMIEFGSTPGHNVYVDIIEAFCKLGKIDEAINFLEDKHVFEISPHNALLAGCCSAGKFFVAKGLLGKMSERNIDNIDSWNIIIGWLCKNAGSKKALEFLGRMILWSFVPDSNTYAALIIGNCKLHKYEDAWHLFDNVRVRCWILNSESYSQLLEGLCRGKMIPEAVELFRYMSRNRNSLQPSSFDILIKEICDMGKIDEAIGLLKLVYYSGTPCTTATYSSIMIGLSKYGKAKELLVMVSKMVVEGFSLTLDIYCILIERMSKENRIKDCVWLFNMMMDGGFVPDSERLYKMLTCIGNQCELHMVLSGIDKVISNDKVVNSEICNLLVNGLWKEGNREEAGRVLDMMLEKGWMPDVMTHKLLVGKEKSQSKRLGDDDYDKRRKQDIISNILVEGLCSEPIFEPIFDYQLRLS